MKMRIIAAIFVAVALSTLAILSFNHHASVRSTRDIGAIKELTDRIKRLEQTVAAMERAATERAKQRQVDEATFSPDGKRLLTRKDKSVRLWDAQTGKPITNAVPVPWSGAVAPKATIPPGWQPREFNGMTYYMVPLAQVPHKP